MNRGPAILVILLATAIDGVAILIASGRLSIASLSSWPLAIGLHVLAAVAIGLTVSRFTHRSDGPAGGALTLAVFAFCVTICAPVAGGLAVATLLIGFVAASPGADAPNHVIIGNPLRRETAETVTSRITESLRSNHLSSLRQAGPRLHRNRSRAAVTVLRELQQHADARTQLQAQGALAAIIEAIEGRIDRLRQLEPTPTRQRRIASLLHQLAVSGIHDDNLSSSQLIEATELLEDSRRADAENIECLHLLAQCQMARRNYTALPELIAALRQLPGGSPFANDLEFDYHARLGHWRKVADAVKRSETSAATRRFWLGAAPFPS